MIYLVWIFFLNPYNPNCYLVAPATGSGRLDPVKGCTALLLGWLREGVRQLSLTSLILSCTPPCLPVPVSLSLSPLSARPFSPQSTSLVPLTTRPPCSLALACTFGPWAYFIYLFYSPTICQSLGSRCSFLVIVFPYLWLGGVVG